MRGLTQSYRWWAPNDLMVLSPYILFMVRIPVPDEMTYQGKDFSPN